ncbi:MAG: hypothetical protein WEF50_16520 [Myxococcota bacterium]
MALQSDARSGVAVERVWDLVHEVWPDLDALADRAGWPRDEVASIGFYRAADARYNFPTLAEYLEFFRSVGFDVVGVDTPSYELGERCPTLVLAKR